VALVVVKAAQLQLRRGALQHIMDGVGELCSGVALFLPFCVGERKPGLRSISIRH